MAIWHTSISKPGYKATITIVKKSNDHTKFNYDTVVFEGDSTGSVINKVEYYIEKYFANLNKDNYSVSVKIDSYNNYDLQI